VIVEVDKIDRMTPGTAASIHPPDFQRTIERTVQRGASTASAARWESRCVCAMKLAAALLTRMSGAPPSRRVHHRLTASGSRISRPRETPCSRERRFGLIRRLRQHSAAGRRSQGPLQARRTSGHGEAKARAPPVIRALRPRKSSREKGSTLCPHSSCQKKQGGAFAESADAFYKSSLFRLAIAPEGHYLRSRVCLLKAGAKLRLDHRQ